jgi:2-polyprenyl-3-methyl-5-hydroxy-6-metoxy-1,4-benzoquinol methylase
MNADPRLDKAIQYIKQSFPIVASGLLDPSDSDLGPYASRVLDYYFRKNGEDSFNSALDGLAKLSIDFIRLHARFVRTRTYRATSSAHFSAELYSQPAKMKEYLDGLLLSYALWPNHTLIYRFFDEAFVQSVSETATVVEIGVGHGLMAATVLGRSSNIRYTGFDLSDSSLEYTRAMLQSNGVSQLRYSLHNADATAAISNHLPESLGPRAAICGEVLEHVEHPEKILDTLHRLIGIGGRAFVTTVANIDAEDHIYLFHDREHIRKTLNESDFRVEKELAISLDKYATDQFVPMNYAAVIEAC